MISSILHARASISPHITQLITYDSHTNTSAETGYRAQNVLELIVFLNADHLYSSTLQIQIRSRPLTFPSRRRVAFTSSEGHNSHT